MPPIYCRIYTVQQTTALLLKIHAEEEPRSQTLEIPESERKIIQQSKKRLSGAPSEYAICLSDMSGFVHAKRS